MSEASRRGAEMLGMTLHPHQLALGDLLDQRIETTAICWPRRAGKTESIWCWMLGMMDLHEDFKIVTTAQTGVKGRERFLDKARRLDRFYPQDAGGPVIKRGAIVDMTFKNGSRLWVVAPDEDAFRGDAANVVFFDEAQSYSLQQSKDLKQGALPLLDTVMDGMVVLAGTPGPARSGWFWDALEAGRDGKPGHTLSEYAAPDEADPHDEQVWVDTHPGIGTLTTLDKMHARHAEMDPVAWSQEYLGMWPLSAVSRAIDYEAWKACALPALPDRPERFALAYDCHPKDASAALVAAWRDEEGNAVFGLLHRQNGTKGFSKVVYDAVTKHKVDVHYDDIGPSHEVAEVLGREAKSRNRVKKVTTKDLQAGQMSLVRQIRDKTVRHPDQPGLNTAAEMLQWKENREFGRTFGWLASGGDISPIRAAAMALWAYDSQKAPTKTAILVAT